MCAGNEPETGERRVAETDQLDTFEWCKQGSKSTTRERSVADTDQLDTFEWCKQGSKSTTQERSVADTNQLDTPQPVDVDDALLHGGAREVPALPDDHMTPDVVKESHEGQNEDGEDETLGPEDRAPRFTARPPVVQ